MQNIHICREGCFVCQYNSWTKGLEILRDMGFTIYKKDHIAFKGQINEICNNILVEASIEVKHNRQTDKWEIELHAFYGKQQFSVEKTEKIIKCSVKGMQDDWNSFAYHFREQYQAQMKIINNIYRNSEE